MFSGLDSPGLFRASGTPALVEQMKASADKGATLFHLERGCHPALLFSLPCFYCFSSSGLPFPSFFMLLSVTIMLLYAMSQLRLTVVLSGERINFAKAEDVNAVCALIKQYIRELPEPVIPESYTDAFVSAVGKCTAFSRPLFQPHH